MFLKPQRTSKWFWPGGLWLLFVWSVVEGGFAGTAPPSMELQVEGATIGSCTVKEGSSEKSGGTTQSITTSLLARRSFSTSGWFVGVGVAAERFIFGGDDRVPRHLQNFGGTLALEYYQGGEQVGALTLHPGFYFGGERTSRAWDVPVDFATGVPLFRGVDGVIGCSNARFLHHPVPVFGVMWKLNPKVRLEAAYPEPAVVVTLDKNNSLRFGGMLSGGGFLVGTVRGNRVLEYSSYRVGGTWSREGNSGLSFTLGAGIEIERSFDYFRENRRLHGGGAGYLTVTAALSR